MLVVGNSLFERGINIPVLQQELPGFTVQRFVVSDTSFLDWYYGLRRIFAEGGKPRVVVLGLSTRNLLAQRIEGALSANILIRTSDVLRVGRDLHYDNTAVTNLYFENLSAFFGGSTQFRKWLLTGVIMPDLQQLAAGLKAKTPPLPASAEVIAEAAPRLQMLNQLCAENGVRLVFVVPPTGDQGADSDIPAVETAGGRADVVVLVPIGPGELGPQYFSDGAHLTDAGALKFTSALSSALRRTLPYEVNARLF
jgi:hypothetical protein